MSGTTVSSQQSSRLPVRIVILGGGYAGVLAALRLAGKARRRRVPVEVLLVNGADCFVERVRLHELAAGRPARRIALAPLLEGSGVELLVGWARRIHAEARTVEVDLPGGEATRTLTYDALVYAPGSAAAAAVLPGAADHAFALAERPGAQALGRRLAEARPGERVVVVGGGLTGIEAATEIAEAFPGLRVTLATAGRVGEGLSERGRAYLADTFRALGVTVREGARALEARQDGLLVEPGDGANGDPELLRAEILVLGVGLRASGLAEASGLPTTPEGRLVVGADLRSPAHPEIWAAGDAAAVLGADGAQLRMACAAAMPQGAHVADAILAALAGDPPPRFGFAFATQCMSLGRRRGLVQPVSARDEARPRVITGRLGALIKELICRYTVLSLRLERRFPGSFHWPGMGSAAVAGPAAAAAAAAAAATAPVAAAAAAAVAAPAAAAAAAPEAVR